MAAWTGSRIRLSIKLPECCSTARRSGAWPTWLADLAQRPAGLRSSLLQGPDRLRREAWRSGMARDLLLAVGLPLVVLLLALLALEHWQGRLPPWLARLSQRQWLLWNTGVGLIIVLSLLRWLLHR